MSATLRPLYSMYRGVPVESSTTFARCGRLYTVLPFSTVLTRVGAVAFHWARRMRVLARDILRFGTAIGFSSLFLRVCVVCVKVVCVNVVCLKLCERSPPRVYSLSRLPVWIIGQLLARFRVEAWAIRATDWLER